MVADGENIVASIRLPDIPQVLRPAYSNDVDASYTSHDFRLVFSVLTVPLQAPKDSAGENVKLHATAVAEVIVPASLMHSFLTLLRHQFDEYLSRYGPPGLNPEGPGREIDAPIVVGESSNDERFNPEGPGREIDAPIVVGESSNDERLPLASLVAEMEAAPSSFTALEVKIDEQGRVIVTDTFGAAVAAGNSPSEAITAWDDAARERYLDLSAQEQELHPRLRPQLSFLRRLFG
jgi:hypothetical protein